MKKRVLLWSMHPAVPSGYGTVCRNLAIGLKDYFDVAVFPIYFNPLPMSLDGITVLPVPLMQNAYNGHDLIAKSAANWQADVVIQHFDIWTLYNNLSCYKDLPNLIVYSPVDGIPLPAFIPKCLEVLQPAAVVPMCKFAEDVYQKTGIKTEKYIYHGVDTSIYYPRDKSAARKAWGLPEGKFIAGMVATNISNRKNIPGQMRAFRRFQQGYCPDAVLALWTYPTKDNYNPQGYNLPLIWEQLGGDTKTLVMPDSLQYTCGTTEDQMANFYSAIDVLLSCTMGEGFGLPIIESMACGTPVIGTDFSSMPELIGDNGWLVKAAAYYCQNITFHWLAIPDEWKIVEALYKAKTVPHPALLSRDLNEYIAGRFDWQNNIIPQWVELINRIV